MTPAVMEGVNAYEANVYESVDEVQDQALTHGLKIIAAFDGGIGVHPVGGVAGETEDPVIFPNVSRNLVKGVVPAPGPWRIADLKAVVDSYGRIRVKGRGLLLAGGDNIGRTLNIKVFATLICEAAKPFVERSTAVAVDGGGFEGVVPLEPNGDFFIEDTLKTDIIIINNGTQPVFDPSLCPHPTLLIRAGSGAWLAAGIPILPRNEL
jgi:hypothetical protein